MLDLLGSSVELASHGSEVEPEERLLFREQFHTPLQDLTCG